MTRKSNGLKSQRVPIRLFNGGGGGGHLDGGDCARVRYVRVREYASPEPSLDSLQCAYARGVRRGGSASEYDALRDAYGYDCDGLIGG